MSSGEAELIDDPRFQEAVRLFNAADWYACHDGFEELWHETQGECRAALQGLLQIAVAHLHLERGNRRGATVLLGEGLGRLRRYGSSALGLDLTSLRHCAAERLEALQRDRDPDLLPRPELRRSDAPQS
ncbi:MAG: DUF309 domain-containing protein [Cyanobium sp.]